MLPIAAIGILGFLLIIERIVFFVRKRCDADRLLRRIGDLAAEGKWTRAGNRGPLSGKTHWRVIAAGVDCREMNREDMENALQEAILKEAPATERFLSTLAMLAAIAPLLGLLGTVTGMINLFHMITQYGNSDPRMMSGGISEALLTTMLGLAVAIPLLFGHTLLSRKADRLIEQMEEKAMALINMFHTPRQEA
jgi:biopolymer transport protein ExbB